MTATYLYSSYLAAEIQVTPYTTICQSYFLENPYDW